MKSKLGSGLLDVLAYALVAAGVSGWVWNIVKIVDSDFGSITGMLVARVIGVLLAPLGSVLGFL